MNGSLPFFNFSLRKVLARETDSLNRARIQIVFTTLVLLILKILILFPFVFDELKTHQFYRLTFVLLLYLGLTKYLLYQPKAIAAISHIIILTGVASVWSTLFVFGQRLNLVTIQFVFMVIFVGYYLIDKRYAIFYSFSAIIAVMLYLVMRDQALWQLDATSQEIPSPGFEIIVMMNFSTMVYIHYLFYRAFRDNVAEKESLNRQLQTTIAEVKALADSRSVFLSTMSHELRTPLNAVLGMTHLIKDTATQEQADNLDILEFSATSLLTLVNDILDYNKGENDKITLEAIPVNLAILLHKVCYGLQQKATEKGFDLVLQVDDGLKDKWVTTDPTRLTQIIYNLGGNAIKFTEKGQVNVKASADDEGNGNINVHFSIADTGIGIPDNRQAVIFEPFVQASADTTRHYGGTGLGLAIVKRLLTLFNSTIALESHKGEGSTFSFSINFPLYQGDVKPVSAHAAAAADLLGLKVLIAEDNPVNAMLLTKLLGKWNVISVVAVNGQEAVSKLMSDNFDIVLMDLHMPIMDGYEAAFVIRGLTDPTKSQIPVIALTASVSHNIFEKIKEAGMQDYLSKPFLPAALYQKLAALKIAEMARTGDPIITIDPENDAMTA